MCPPKCRYWFLNSHSFLVSFYWSSTGIKRLGRDPNNSAASNAQVMMHNTKSPLALRLQLNEQQKVKAVCPGLTVR